MAVRTAPDTRSETGTAGSPASPAPPALPAPSPGASRGASSPGASWGALPPTPARLDGALRVRLARPCDRQAVEEFFERCSPETRYRRFHGVSPALVREEAARIVRPSTGHRSLLAVSAGGEVRGVGTLALGSDGEAELAFVVEDAWMRRGVGRRLARGLVREARRLRLPALVAYVQADNARARDFFRSVAPGARVRYEAGELVVDIPLPAA